MCLIDNLLDRNQAFGRVDSPAQSFALFAERHNLLLFVVGRWANDGCGRKD